MAKYQGKYRIESARLEGYDYRSPGEYFITICTHNRQHFFGECRNGKMKLSTVGAIVQGFWYEIPKHFPHVQLGAFQVMPNHIHGILILGEMANSDKMKNESASSVGTRHCHVPTDDADDADKTDNPIPPIQNDNQPLSKSTPDFYRKIVSKPGSVSVIIGSYKSICTRHINQVSPDIEFRWQERFWDNIIRNHSAYQRISNYIHNNPKNWKEDKFFPPK